jgi:hypothetical protein
VRLEVPLHRYLASGVALQLGGETGADLRQAGGFASAGGDTDYMILLKPRLPLFAGRHELSAIALGGLSARRHLRGGVPWPQGDGSSEARSVKADATTWAPFFALGLGFTTWLDTHWGAFVELTVLRRHTDGRIREDDFDFVPASLLDRSWYAFELEETSARLVFGFGYAMGVP